jgi:putative tryptophan/tyrosine transport system substrate-binding protein
MRRTVSAIMTVLAVLWVTPAVSQTSDQARRIAVLTPTAATWPLISKGLAARGFVEGRNILSNVQVGAPDQLPILARDLVAAKPAVIVAVSSALAAVRAATAEVPIVGYGPDPVEQGFAEAYARPGGNVTGVAIFAAQLDGKRLELLAEGMPGQRMAVLLSPNTQSANQSRRAIEMVARRLGNDPLFVEAGGPEDYPAAFAALRAAGVKSLVITATAWFFRDRELLGGLAREAGIATMCEWGDMALSACTVGYGPQRADLLDRVADQVARILQGTQPRDLPIEQPTRFELVINVKSAKAIGATISPSLLARADEVIE